MKRLCTICARGGSKGVPKKNITPLQGKPLIMHSIDHAKDSGLFDCIAVSSDSDEILALAMEAGVMAIKRPEELATDTAGKLPAIGHALAFASEKTGLTFDTHVDLDATSPLRMVEDVASAVHLLETSGASNVITACPARRSPYFNLIEWDNQKRSAVLSKPLPHAVLRRQDAPHCYDMNASIYVWSRAAIEAHGHRVFYNDTQLLVMPEARSVDVDHPLDFKIVSFIMEQGLHLEGQSYAAGVEQLQELTA